MTTIRLFGTVTSPYVRRVRIAALELGVPVELIDTSTESGQAALRAFHPLWKVPAAEIEGDAVFDSSVIQRELFRRYGPGSLTPTRLDHVPTQNLITVIDGALDSLINVFYLAKDAVSEDQSAYMTKQRQRVRSAMAWLEPRITERSPETFGWIEIAAITAFEWMRFRSTYPIDDHAALVEWMAPHAKRNSVIQTAPPG